MEPHPPEGGLDISQRVRVWRGRVVEVDEDVRRLDELKRLCICRVEQHDGRVLQARLQDIESLIKVKNPSLLLQLSKAPPSRHGVK